MEKPIRLLHDWAVFDARPTRAKDAGGALALALVSLQVLEDVLDATDVGCVPEGAGAASPYFENEEDAGQEDDGDYDDDDDIGGNEEEGRAVEVRLRLGALLRYSIDYTKRDEYVSHSLSGMNYDVDVFWCRGSQPDVPRDDDGLVHPRRSRARVPRALRIVLPCAQNRTGSCVHPHARPAYSSQRLYL